MGLREAQTKGGLIEQSVCVCVRVCVCVHVRVCVVAPMGVLTCSDSAVCRVNGA